MVVKQCIRSETSLTVLQSVVTIVEIIGRSNQLINLVSVKFSRRKLTEPGYLFRRKDEVTLKRI